MIDINKPDYYVVHIIDENESIIDTKRFISKDNAETYAEELQMRFDLHTKVVGISETVICEYEV